MHTIIMISCPGLTLIGLSGTAQDQPLACSRYSDRRARTKNYDFSWRTIIFFDGGQGGVRGWEGGGGWKVFTCKRYGSWVDSPKAASLVTRTFSRADLARTRVPVFGYWRHLFPVLQNFLFATKASHKMAVVCFTQGTCVMEQSDNDIWFNTEMARLSPTPRFGPLISSLWVDLICYCRWHAFSLFIPV